VSVARTPEPAPTRLSCPNCAKNFRVRNYKSGAEMECPDCKGPLIEPVGEPEEIALKGEVHQGGWELPVRLGRYHIEGQIARGGMGVVFKAKQEGLDRLVAIKMMLPGPAGDAETVRRFEREARSAARLKHPNIVAIHEIGDYRGIPFFSMDFVDGPSLEDAMHQAPIPPRRIAEIIRDVARAVQFAHDHGIVHRDLKPGNVMLEKDVPRLTDFGLAKDVASQSLLSMTGEIMGTPSYMSPEQAEGRVRELGPSTDVYSLGAVLYRVLVGRPPHEAATPIATVHDVIHRDPPEPLKLNKQCPAELSAITMKAMEKEPRDRYTSAEELAKDLDRFLAGEPVIARPMPAWKRLRRQMKKQRTAVRIAAAGVGLGLVAAVAAFFVFRKSPLDVIEGNLAAPELSIRQNAIASLIGDFDRHAESDRARAIALLAGALAKDRDEKTRALTLDVLDRRPALAAHALPWLEEEKPPALRIRLLEILGRGKVREAVDAVVPLLKSPDVEVKRAAVKFFIHVPDPGVFYQLGLLIADRDVGAEARAAIDRQYVNKVIALFNPAGANVGGALGELGRTLQEHNRMVEGVLNEGDPKNAPKDAAEAAMAALGDKDERNRMKAAIELGRTPAKKAAEALCKAMGDPDDGVAKAAAYALGETGAGRFREQLAPMLKDGRAVARRNAAYLLGVLKDTSAKQALEEAFKAERDEDAKGAILDALQALRK